MIRTMMEDNHDKVEADNGATASDDDDDDDDDKEEQQEPPASAQRPASTHQTTKLWNLLGTKSQEIIGSKYEQWKLKHQQQQRDKGAKEEKEIDARQNQDETTDVGGVDDDDDDNNDKGIQQLPTPPQEQHRGAQFLKFFDNKRMELFQSKQEEREKKKGSATEETAKGDSAANAKLSTSSLSEEDAAAKDAIQQQQEHPGKAILDFFDAKQAEFKEKYEDWKSPREEEEHHLKGGEDDAREQNKEEEGDNESSSARKLNKGDGGESNGANHQTTPDTGQAILGFLQKRQSELQRNIEANKLKLIESIGRSKEHYFWGGGPIIEFPETGRSVRLQQQIAHGGFSCVFKAIDVTPNPTTTSISTKDNSNDNMTTSNATAIAKEHYALKRIQCIDEETQMACIEECNIHYALADRENYILPLLGFTFHPNDNVCYMLFPYMSNSLRNEINKRLFVDDISLSNNNKPALVADPVLAATKPPWKETLVWKMFYHLLHGVSIMHGAGYAHCDIKVDNILFYGNEDRDDEENSLKRPILMDFGSAVTPTKRRIQSRQDIMEIVEQASQHTTMPYRPPELFEGEIRLVDKDCGSHGDLADVLDYTLVDVWSLGCTLFAILFGASPFESAFSRATGRHRVIDCSQLTVLGEIPKPPKENVLPCYEYSDDFWDILEWILQKDRRKRPTLKEVQVRVEALMVEATVRELALGGKPGPE